MTDFDAVIQYLERRCRDAQKDKKKQTSINVMDLAWVCDVLESVRVKMEEKK